MSPFQSRIFVASLLSLAAFIPSSEVCRAQQGPHISVLYFSLGEAASQTAHNSLGITGNLGNDFSREMVNRLAASHKVEVTDSSSRPERRQHRSHYSRQAGQGTRRKAGADGRRHRVERWH